MTNIFFTFADPAMVFIFEEFLEEFVEKANLPENYVQQEFENVVEKAKMAKILFKQATTNHQNIETSENRNDELQNP